MSYSEPPEWFEEHYGYHESKTKKVPKAPIELYPWPDLKNLGRRKYIIKGLLDAGSLSVLYGESNTGKTFAAIDIAAHISLGWKWRGLNTKKGSVVYIASEGGYGMADRLQAFYEHYQMDIYGDMFVSPRTIILSGEDNDCDQLISKIKETQDVMLVVVDTLARAMSGGNENSSDDMGFFIRCCDKIREETGAHVMIVHHSGKDVSKGARGHSSLRAAIDTEIQLSQDSGVITAEILKQRDGRVGEKFSFRLEVVQVGIDEDGDPVESCVLVPCDPAMKAKRLSDQKRRALSILYNCVIDKGQRRQIRAGMPEVNCVTISEFREYLKREKLSSSDKPDSENRAITRAIDELNNARITCSYEDYIWVADKQDKDRQKRS